MKEYSIDTEDSNDSEPEEVGFFQGRVEANQVLKDIASEVKKLKENLKRKRTLVHERNSSQKQAKLKRIEALENRKLPVEFLDGISKIAGTPKTSVSISASVPTISKSNENQERTEDDSSDKVEIDTQPDLKTPEDFISLHGTTKFNIAVLADELKKPKSLSVTAADFRKNMLNRKGVRRETVKEMLSKKEKQQMNGNLTFK